ncbi:MAG TPA: efflux RND transporter permease subunit [Bacilli bacterium]|nr:efflux RND transporter permease subunit [Bacilli bacterium]
MSFLTRLSLKNPVAIFILAFLLIFGGLYAFQSLKVEMLPNIEFPQLTVQTVYPGASPNDVDEQVTSKLEAQFKKLDGLDSMTSQSFESVSIISLQFPFDTDMDAMSQKVEDLIGESHMPDNVPTPEVNRLSFGALPVVSAAAFAKGDVDIQTLIADKIRPELEKIPGVSSVAIGGGAEEMVTITVDKAKALQHGLTLSQIQEAIKSQSLSMPAGTVVNDSVLIPVRVEQKLDTVEGLKNLRLSSGQQAAPAAPSAPNPTGKAAPFVPAHAPLTLADIATITTESARTEITRFNNEDAIALTVTKKQDANTVEVADKTHDVLDKYSDQMEYGIVFDQSEGIKQSVDTLIREGLLGALFASIAVLLFLRNLRATIIAVLSIPLSLVVSSIFLSRAGITLNIMTLGGMAVAVGRVVDDSIVVIENIFRRMKMNKEGTDPSELTIDATREMFKAITSSTLTTIVVFLPLGLVGGITGEFFLPFALTIVFALVASLLVSITLTPLLARFSFSKVVHEEREGKLQHVYARVIEWSLRRKGLVLVLSVVLLVGSLALSSQLGFVFLPNEKQKLLMANVTMPASTVLEKTNEVSLEIEKMLGEREDTIDMVFAGIGSRDFQTGLRKGNTAQYFISLNETADVTQEVKTLQKKMEEITHRISPDASVAVQEMSTGGPPSNNNVDIDLYSTDVDKLLAASKLVEKELAKHDDLKYITNNLKEKQTQWVIEIDPDKAAAHGVSAFTVLGLTADQTRPVNVGLLKLDGEDRQVELTYDKSLTSQEDLENLTLFGQQGPVKLRDVATVRAEQSITSIQKLDGKEYARVSATIDSQNVQAIAAQVKADVQANVKLPDGVSLEAGGGTDETAKTFQDLLLAMGIAVGLVYLVMLFTFGQARVPFVILSSLLFVPTGAIGALYLVGEPMSVSAMIGILMLIGIVVTNAIVLVDRVGQNRADGMTIHEALIEGGKTRLRPILMTAFATICALLPLAFTTAEGSLISKGLALVVIGGLTTSTLLTLIIVPVMYELFFLRTHRREQKMKLH